MDQPDSQPYNVQADNRVVVSLRRLIDLQYRARGISFSAAKSVDSVMVGRHRSRLRGRGLDFEELRHYRVGDDIRTMDWKVTNRTRKPHVRVYSEERERRVMLALDQRGAMFFGSRGVMKSVQAAQLAALAGWRTLADGDRVGAMVFNDQQIVEVPPRRQRGHMMQLLHHVQRFNRQLLRPTPPNPAQLNHILRHLDALGTHDMLVCLITDLSGADALTEKLLSRLVQHNDLILFFVYDPLEKNLPDSGRLAVSDGELQLEIDTRDRELRQRYRDYFEQRLARAKQFLHGYQVPILPIDTTLEPEPQLLQLLQPTGVQA